MCVRIQCSVTSNVSLKLLVFGLEHLKISLAQHEAFHQVSI